MIFENFGKIGVIKFENFGEISKIKFEEMKEVLSLQENYQSYGH